MCKICIILTYGMRNLSILTIDIFTGWEYHISNMQDVEVKLANYRR